MVNCVEIRVIDGELRIETFIIEAGLDRLHGQRVAMSGRRETPKLRALLDQRPRAGCPRRLRQARLAIPPTAPEAPRELRIARGVNVFADAYLAVASNPVGYDVPY
jgi:hypothetical protein